MLGSQANQGVWDTWQYGWCCSDNTAACTKLGCDAKCASTSCYQQSNMQQCLSMFMHYGLSNFAVSYRLAKFRLFGVWFVSLRLFTKKNKNRYHQTIRNTGINTLMLSPLLFSMLLLRGVSCHGSGRRDFGAHPNSYSISTWGSNASVLIYIFACLNLMFFFCRWVLWHWCNFFASWELVFLGAIFRH